MESYLFSPVRVASDLWWWLCQRDMGTWWRCCWRKEQTTLNPIWWGQWHLYPNFAQVLAWNQELFIVNNCNDGQWYLPTSVGCIYSDAMCIAVLRASIPYKFNFCLALHLWPPIQCTEWQLCTTCGGWKRKLWSSESVPKECAIATHQLH